MWHMLRMRSSVHSDLCTFKGDEVFVKWITGTTTERLSLLLLLRNNNCKHFSDQKEKRRNIASAAHLETVNGQVMAVPDSFAKVDEETPIKTSKPPSSYSIFYMLLFTAINILICSDKRKPSQNYQLHSVWTGIWRCSLNKNVDLNKAHHWFWC